MKKSIIIIIVTIIVIGLGYFISRPIIDSYHEIEQIRQERDSIIHAYDSLQVLKVEKDSTVNRLIRNENRKVDSVKNNYSLKLNNLKNEYKGKIDNVDELSIDDNIRLFTELISEKDSI